MLGVLNLPAEEGDASAAVTVEARAQRKPLGSLVPKLTRDFPETGARGTLDWDMKADLTLASSDGVRRMAEATLLGELSITQASVPLPKNVLKSGCCLTLACARSVARAPSCPSPDVSTPMKSR